LKRIAVSPIDQDKSVEPPPAPEVPVGVWRPDTAAPKKIVEIGGRKDGTDPTRYGDWEKNGRCIDF
jgi:hypothetical protein